jgi:hypothetical protein
MMKLFNILLSTIEHKFMIINHKHRIKIKTFNPKIHKSRSEAPLENINQIIFDPLLESYNLHCWIQQEKHKIKQILHRIRTTIRIDCEGKN